MIWNLGLKDSGFGGLRGLGLGRGGLASKAWGLRVEGLADQDYGIQGLLLQISIRCGR